MFSAGKDRKNVFLIPSPFFLPRSAFFWLLTIIVISALAYPFLSFASSLVGLSAILLLAVSVQECARILLHRVYMCVAFMALLMVIIFTYFSLCSVFLAASAQMAAGGLG